MLEHETMISQRRPHSSHFKSIPLSGILLLYEHPLPRSSALNTLKTPRPRRAGWVFFDTPKEK
jgi:hypothetical protein